MFVSGGRGVEEAEGCNAAVVSRDIRRLVLIVGLNRCLRDISRSVFLVALGELGVYLATERKLSLS